MVLQGVSSLLTPVPKAEYNNRETPDQRASFLFNGATNRSAEGTAVPLIYGRFRAGSVIASAGITVEQLL
jgi:predicted phage tail protein